MRWLKKHESNKMLINKLCLTSLLADHVIPRKTLQDTYSAFKQ